MGCDFIPEAVSRGSLFNLRPFGNRPVAMDASLNGPIANRPQVNNLPHDRV
jgi:hypothetical protein